MSEITYKQVKIFIPTKNRLDNESTYNILKDIGLNPILVIEPQEQEQAELLKYNYITLDENNQGITYARNFILNYAKKNKYEFICMLDDDIKQFGYIVKNDKANNKLKQSRKKDNMAFIDALNKFIEYKSCGTMQYTQFAWNQVKPIVFNRGLEVVWFLYMPQLENVIIEYDTIEDRDFSLDIIINYDVKTFRLNHHYFLVPSIGTNKGGIESSTRALKQKYWSYKMLNKWGENIISIIRKTNNYYNIKINWRYVDKLINKKRYDKSRIQLNLF